MTIKTRLISAFKNHVLKPQLNRIDKLEANVFNRPGALRGGGTSPVRFNIPREGLKMEGDHPPLPGFPRSFPQMVGSMINICKSVLDLDRNPTDGPKQIDPDILDELRRFAIFAGAD